MAEDATGRLLFVWLAERNVGGEVTRDLVGRGYTSAGVAVDAAPLAIELDVGATQPIRPTVTGLDAGWAVTWRSTRVEGASGEQGGIALSVVSRDGVVGTRRLVNQITRLDQLDPVIATLDDGLVVAWTDLSVDGATPRLRRRHFDDAGRPTTAELSVAADATAEASSTFVVSRTTAFARSNEWAIAWTSSGTEVGDLPEIRMRRFDGPTALDAADLHASHAWGAGPSLASNDDGFYVAWTSLATDTNGDVAVRFVDDDTTAIADDMDVETLTAADSGTFHRRDDAPAIAAFDGGYVVAYQTNASPPGLRWAVSDGLTLPTEADVLEDLWISRQAGASFRAAARGLWVVWTDPAMTTATDAVVGHLVPWE
jgi:hypothetical protein